MQCYCRPAVYKIASIRIACQKKKSDVSRQPNYCLRVFFFIFFTTDPNRVLVFLVTGLNCVCKSLNERSDICLPAHSMSYSKFDVGTVT